MKTTVTVTSRGVVTLPVGLRRALGIKAGDRLIAETTAEGLLLRPAVTLPIEMHSDVVEVAGRNLQAKAPASLSSLEQLLARLRVAPMHIGREYPAVMRAVPERDRPVVAAAITRS